VQSSLYVAIIAAIFALFILWRLLFVNILHMFRKFCKAVQVNLADHENVEYDFYTCVNLRTLNQLLKDSESDLKFYLDILNNEK